MRNYLSTKAPWWLLVLINGAWFAVVSAVVSAVIFSFDWPDDILRYVVSGLIFGLLTATFTVGARRRR